MRTALSQQGYSDIPANGLHVLGRLALAADGLPIRTLVEELGVTKQATGQLVDTLVARGYVLRSPDVTDRRQQIVSLADAGRRAAATQSAAREAIDGALLAAVGEADLAVTRRTLTALIDLGAQPTGTHLA